MKASVVDGYPKGNKMKILIEDAEASHVNALRRAIMADVPKMAISKVMFTLGVNEDNNNRGEFTNPSMPSLTKLLLIDWQ